MNEQELQAAYLAGRDLLLNLYKEIGLFIDSPVFQQKALGLQRLDGLKAAYALGEGGVQLMERVYSESFKAQTAPPKPAKEPAVNPPSAFDPAAFIDSVVKS